MSCLQLAHTCIEEGLHRLVVSAGLIWQRALDGNAKQMEPGLPTGSQQASMVVRAGLVQSCISLRKSMLFIFTGFQ